MMPQQLIDRRNRFTRRRSARNMGMIKVWPAHKNGLFKPQAYPIELGINEFKRHHQSYDEQEDHKQTAWRNYR